MSGYDRNQRRIEQLMNLGRNLARRASSACEICEQSGRPLKPYEVPPLPDEPNLEHAVLACDDCRMAMDGGPMNDDEWRALSGPMWSAVPPIQVSAVRLIRRLADTGIQWAKDDLDGLYLEPEVQAWVDDC